MSDAAEKYDRTRDWEPIDFEDLVYRDTITFCDTNGQFQSRHVRRRNRAGNVVTSAMYYGEHEIAPAVTVYNLSPQEVLRRKLDKTKPVCVFRTGERRVGTTPPKPPRAFKPKVCDDKPEIVEAPKAKAPKAKKPFRPKVAKESKERRARMGG